MSYSQPDGPRPSLSRRAKRKFTAGLETGAARSSSSASNGISGTAYGDEKQRQELTAALLRAQELERQELENKKKAWASWVNQQYTACKNARQQFERQWYLNLAFVNGRHYVSPVEVAGQGFRLTSPKAPPWRVRLVINKSRSAIKAETAKLSSSRPIPTVLPATEEEQDFAAAKVGEALLKNAFANADFERTYRDWIWWGSVTGCSFIKSYWSANEPDPDLMTPQKPAVGIDGEPLYDQNGEPQMQPQQPVMGRIVMERITPFHVFVPDLMMPDINKQPYVIHVTTRSPLWVQRTFGFKPTPDSRASNTIMESAFIINRNSEEVLDSVLVKEMWLKKNAHPDFPEGGLITIINERVVQYQQKWPWPFIEYPFYKYDGLPTGSFYSDSMLVDLIPLNKEYNRTRSQMVEIKNMMGKPKFMYPQGSVNIRQISSEPGQGIPYKQGFDKPTIMPGVDVPSSMHQELERLNMDFDDISNQHEINRGGSPTGVTSGTAIAFLQEQDDNKLHYQVSSIEYAMEMLGKHYLKYVSHYWEDERLVKITGKDSEYEAKLWKGSDLKGNTDVRIRTGSALPTSKAAKQALLTEWMQYGWLDPQIGMELMDMGGLDKAIDQMLMDKRQASRENLKMAELDPSEVGAFLQPPQPPMDMMGQPQLDEAGQPVGVDPVTGGPLDHNGMPWQPKPPVPVNSWDNHEAHIQFHNNYRKSQEFELLDDSIKQAFELHVQMHQMAIAPPPLMGQLGPVMGNTAEDAMMQEQAGMEQEQMGMEQEQAQAQGEQQQLQGSLDSTLTLSQIAANESRVQTEAAQREQMRNQK